ncbi:SAM-dependent methyltransferase [Engelhardtia mirabilis]|uniref:Demethylrebeccamycin-D-glucose O-methyltransferase n=1 Tax=Engelhardtia mirabilis TaxID=2528011 RepID=A0A518BMW5_9BACT|nr:Demethylrebeccamycin-D-glucose O-methyltransferase [Planctomycetes bacterium Pla133]QDV02656.1 Demethylrebeccamycin-D-glucose O-methyltransferase [Planctomycetes bacterium Pla86]
MSTWITIDSPASRKDIAAHYGELDEAYRRLWGEHLHHGLWESGRELVQEAIESLVHRVARTLELRPGMELCDVGCGYGGTSWLLAEHYGQRVTGLTITPEQVERARARPVPSATVPPRFLLADWLENDFADASFERLVSLECIGHVPDKARFFRELHRVLRPGGQALVTAWLTQERPSAWRRRHLLEPICREGRLPSMGSAQAYGDLARAAGLDVLSYEDLSAKVLRTWSICLQRTLAGLATDHELRRFLVHGRSSNRVFALTLVRIWLAYRVGAMEYGWFHLRRPEAAYSSR